MPVLRDAEPHGLRRDREGDRATTAKRAREGKLQARRLTGGTFTITNGGMFGSLMSTPIVNPPQSGILGMHAIKERPIVENGQIVVAADDVHRAHLRPPHHRRKDAVLFLVDIKNRSRIPRACLLQI